MCRLQVNVQSHWQQQFTLLSTPPSHSVTDKGYVQNISGSPCLLQRFCKTMYIYKCTCMCQQRPNHYCCSISCSTMYTLYGPPCHIIRVILCTRLPFFCRVHLKDWKPGNEVVRRRFNLLNVGCHGTGAAPMKPQKLNHTDFLSTLESFCFLWTHLTKQKDGKGVVTLTS